MRPLLSLLPALALACGMMAPAQAQDHFSGRYRSVSGADHDIIVVAPVDAGRWSLALERAGWAPTLHPDGAMAEATPARMAQWFGATRPPGAMRCLVAAREDALPLLCSLPPGVELRLRDGLRASTGAPLVATGWLLLVRARNGDVDVTELVKG